MILVAILIFFHSRQRRMMESSYLGSVPHSSPTFPTSTPLKHNEVNEQFTLLAFTFTLSLSLSFCHLKFYLPIRATLIQVHQVMTYFSQYALNWIDQ